MRTRFAPSPTGPLHLGHAYSAMLAHDMARTAGGEFLLRIEDIDRSRARAEWEALIYEDLTWLGLTWDAAPVRQSERGAAYDAALNTLWERGLLYPCTCSRRDIAEALSAPQEGVAAVGPDGPVYPGTCRPDAGLPTDGDMPGDAALRLNMTKALEEIAAISGSDEQILSFRETGSGPDGESGLIPCDGTHMIDAVGDVVLARRDMGTSYHLSVVVDDADQGITDVVRGADLFGATCIHVVLQKLLDLPTPIYSHHKLIRDEAGKRLAKRDDARAIRLFRQDGASAGDIRRMVGL